MFHAELRFNLLRLSTCTAVHVEKRREEVYRSWLALRAERAEFDRQKRMWLEASPRPIDPTRPFCYTPHRMKRIWRDMDRLADQLGFPVHETIGSTNARREWFRILLAAIESDAVIRIRHRYNDEPAVLMRESRFRDLEQMSQLVTSSPASP